MFLKVEYPRKLRMEQEASQIILFQALADSKSVAGRRQSGPWRLEDPGDDFKDERAPLRAGSTERHVFRPGRGRTDSRRLTPSAEFRLGSQGIEAISAAIP
jgi:hypothetical protein